MQKNLCRKIRETTNTHGSVNLLLFYGEMKNVLLGLLKGNEELRVSILKNYLNTYLVLLSSKQKPETLHLTLI